MLQQPNERIDEIFKEALSGIDKSKEHKENLRYDGCFFFLLILLVCSLFRIEWLVYLAIMGALLTLIPPRQSENGGEYDPDFYLPYIMRMVGEILSDQWGEYIYTKKHTISTIRFPSTATTLPEDTPDQSPINPRELQFDRYFDSEYEDTRTYTVILKHPVMKSLQGPNADIYKRMKEAAGKSGCRETLDDQNDSWAVKYDAENVMGKNFYRRKKELSYTQAAWFDYAHSIAECTLNITEIMERELDTIQEQLPSTLFSDRK